MAIAWTTVPAPAPIGALTVGMSDIGVVRIGFGAAPTDLAIAADRLGEPLVVDPERIAAAAGQLAEYLAGTRRAFTLPLDWRLTSGTQRRVLRALYDGVGYGRTVTYGELAERSGAFPGAGHAGRAARGVGSIMGSNPIPVVVPCHRVLAADGVGGFGGGRATKEWLLALEGVLTPALDFDSP
ncbi:methylated-DNA--[protein]-cysteine S-methyltransferase [Pseudonocardia bannensis]|uniref:Methylated-DNA--protein-cysteine methyltransferase n=1 Tax=Pseudonocardia bannensis TaxID=630973 RepID=A0A848DME9_9PSEU|nr:methylated-DNA--[protein]-cysteine S-methyltransferase [Pseudonocardia bannensis]NMH93960.1 methylated-DNA--[protein]-cysteine S-methyltransferase [Pseudonocardia bannensis]